MTSDEATAVLAKHEAMCWWVARRVGADLCHQDQEDLASVVRTQFVRAAKTYDPASGNQFATYALKAAIGQARMAARKIRNRGFNNLLRDGSLPPALVDLDSDEGVAMVDLVPAREECEELPGDDVWDTVGTVLEGSRLVCVLMRFRDGLTLREAGRRLGVSKERVRQLVASGVQQLRESGVFAELVGEPV